MSLILKVTNPDEWRCSFTLAANALIEDVLSDGASFVARLVTELPDGGTVLGITLSDTDPNTWGHDVNNRFD